MLIGRRTLTAEAEYRPFASQDRLLTVRPCPIRSTATVGFTLARPGRTRISTWGRIKSRFGEGK